jgi:hypothetical protein
MVADGFTRSSEADRNGIIISLQTVVNMAGVATPIHDASCWDQDTLKRVTMHRKKLAPMRPNFKKR